MQENKNINFIVVAKVQLICIEKEDPKIVIEEQEHEQEIIRSKK